MLLDDNQSRLIMQPVLRALDAGRETEAVHQFMQALSHDTRFSRMDLTFLLAKLLGRTRMNALVQAFARHPCMACKRGLLLCDECDGKGIHTDGRICDTCVGLGTANCDFCAGSGWITYNYVPSGLRAAVVLARSKLALAAAQEILAEPLPTVRKNNSTAIRKQLAQTLLQTNRLLGAFNNAVGVARRPPDQSSTAVEVLAKVEAACSKAAARLEKRLRENLTLLGEAASVEADKPDSGATLRIAKNRAAFYLHLMQSTDFAGTSLYHPYLIPPQPRPAPDPEASAPVMPVEEPVSPAPPPPEASD